MSSVRVFLLSPARLDGKRAAILLNPRAQFPLARALGEPGGATLGEVFSFLSGLYFRGKHAYATAFGRAPEGIGAVHVITTHRGLLSPDARVTRADLAAFSKIDLATDASAFRGPFLRDARALDAALGGVCEVVLLGSIATGKYVDPLLSVFGERLLFPEAFVGRGDMSRGGLLLRGVRAGAELAYVPVAGAARTGKRPPKLAPIR